MLDELVNQLTPAEFEARRESFAKAREFVEAAGRASGVDAPVRKSWGGRIRIDLEVITGRAFIPDP